MIERKGSSFLWRCHLKRNKERLPEILDNNDERTMMTLIKHTSLTLDTQEKNMRIEAPRQWSVSGNSSKFQLVSG
jgi:hypothetical protein